MTKITAGSVVTKKDNHVETTVDGELVLMHGDDGNFFKLTSTAAIIWSLFDTQEPLSDIVDKLANDYDMPSEQIMEETSIFVQQLQQRDLVTVSS